MLAVPHHVLRKTVRIQLSPTRGLSSSWTCASACANSFISSEQPIMHSPPPSHSATSTLLSVPPNVPLFPLLDSLPPQTTTLTFHAPLTPSELIALTNFLSKSNAQITSLSISDIPLHPTLPLNLLRSISSTTPLRTLVFRNASLNHKLISPLAHLLATTPLKTLTLDLSNNRLNSHGIRMLQSAVQSRPEHFPRISLLLSGNLYTVELLNTLTHGVGALLALLGGIFLTYRAHVYNFSRTIVCSLAAFSLSLVTLMTASAVYHAHFRSPALSIRLQKADHCSIFILIAGSYTPFIVCYALDPPTTSGPLTLVAVWTFAAIGVTRSLLGSDSSRSRALFALVTGWLGVFALKIMVERMDTTTISALVSGGVAYSVGIVFYLLGKKRPILHVIWHLAVMIGGGLHYFALWRYVDIGTDVEDEVTHWISQ